MKGKRNTQTLNKSISNNWFALKIVLKSTPLYIVSKILFEVANAIVMFFEHIYGMKLIIEAIQYNKPFSNVVHYYLIISPFILGLYLFESFYWPYFNIKSTEKLHRDIMSLLYDKTVTIDLEKYDNQEFYNKLVWNITHAPAQIDKLLNNIASVFSGITMLVISIIMFYSCDKVGIIFAIVSLLVSLIIQSKLNKIEFQLDVSLNKHIKKRNYIYRLFYLNDYAKEFRLNTELKKKQFDEFSESNNNICDIYKVYSLKRIWYGFITKYVCKIFTLNGLYVIYLIYMAMIKKVMSYGNVVALYRTASWQFSSGVFSLVNVLPEFSKSSLYMESIRLFLSTENKVADSENAQEVDVSKGNTIEFRNVSFGYNDKEQVLKDINLTINSGEKVAIVGYNGEGKSTFVKLIMRLYDTSSGEILLNGKNITDYAIKSYRNAFSVVFQDFQLIATSIARNVVMDKNYYNKKKVEEALTKSGFEKRLKTLEHGVETQVTREFEDDGVNLSGGEGQKVALARIFYSKSPIIILDEPSSAMDPISEYNLYNNLTRHTKDKTLIYISHRLSTTKLADKIIMFENGRIIEQGTHEQLMEYCGKYAEMFKLQSIKYEHRE